MKNLTKIALIGGDMRHYTTACALSVKGWNVHLWGVNPIAREPFEGVLCKHVEDALSDASAVVLPLPTSTDGQTLSCPMISEGKPLSLYQLLDQISPKTVIIGGRMPRDFCTAAESLGMRAIDYFLLEDFQIKNAYTTAEAALSIAMNSLTREIRGARVAITGYGRIAKSLHRLLCAMEADVTVLARKDSDLAWASLMGAKTVKLEDASARACIDGHLSSGFDVIYNTVPTWLFDRSFLEHVDPKTFLIDLASAPGGVDICAAKELGSNVLWATSLPGKYAPVSAGEGIAACVDAILTREVAT